VVGPSGKKLHVRFEGNKLGAPCGVSELSKTEPVVLPGGFHGGDAAFFASAGLKLENGDSVAYGGKCTIVGKASSDNKVTVAFEGNAVFTSVRVTDLSRTPPPQQLPGGFSINDKVFFTGCSQDLDSEDKLVNGGEGTVVGASVDRIVVAFAGNQGNIGVQLSEISKVSPVLPGGFRGGDEVYFLGSGQTLGNGDKLVYGNPAKVMGPVAADSLALRFENHRMNVTLCIGKFSRSAPPSDLIGGYKVGDIVYFTGCNETFSSGDALTYAYEGVVMGPSGEGRLGVLWRGNKGNASSRPEKLSRTKPAMELVGGYKVNDIVYYNAQAQSFESGDKLSTGLEGNVVGASGNELLVIRFQGNSGNIALKPEAVSKTKQ